MSKMNPMEQFSSLLSAHGKQYRAAELLIVEDYQPDIDRIMHVMKVKDFPNPVHIVHSGEQALDFVYGQGDHKDRNAMPDVILLDIKLPGMSGLEVLEILKSDPRTSRIHIIVMTASTEESLMYESRGLGANDFMTKNASFEDFQQRIHIFGTFWLLVVEDNHS